MKFIDMYKQKMVNWNKIDNFIDSWSNSKSEDSLKDFLGFNDDEWLSFIIYSYILL